MDTATEEPTKPVRGQHGDSEPHVEAIDPEYDVDAKATVIWLVSALVFVLICLWALSDVFAFDVSRQKYEKIDLVPTEELRELRSLEDAQLKKQKPMPSDTRSLAEINDSIRQSTDRIIEEYLKKK